MQHNRIFISGGAGVIGTALVNQLIELGASLFVGDLKPCPSEWRGRLQYRMGDLNTLTQQEIFGFSPELFIHLAATFERSTETPEFFAENYHHNVALSHHLLALLANCPTLNKIVFASSYLIYDPQLYLFPTPQVKASSLKESSATTPRNLCGAAKFFHEAELEFFKNANIHVQTVLARIFRVYGIHSRDVISRWIRSTFLGEKISVYQPEGIFDYIFADDVATGLIKLSESNFSGVVNLGSGKARSVSEVIDVLRKNMPQLQTQSMHPPEASQPFEASQADISLLQTITNWKPTQTLESAIPLLIAAEQQGLRATVTQKPFGVLITSVSKKIPLIQAVKAAMSKLGRTSVVHGCDTNPDCLGKYFVDTFWHCPKQSKLAVRDIVDYCKKHSINAIIPTRDGDLALFSKMQSELLQHNIRVMISDPSTIDICSDKWRFANWLSEKGFPAIATAVSADELNTKSYVVKERFGAGSLSLGLNLNKTQAMDHAKTLKSPIFQPYLSGKEYSIDLYCSEAGKVHGCIARSRDVVVDGESQVTTTCMKPELESLCLKMAHALEIMGHCVFQVLESSDGALHVIECNPRFGGASTASIAAGLDSFLWFFLDCLDQPIYPFVRSSKEIRQVRFPENLLT
ncbi:MAG: ATP-grasp domain-containing protein [Parachlamydiaceae bacterium]|nr:ATP-grasp domain-containing protein [Parachlamydiaceae bacterium]